MNLLKNFGIIERDRWRKNNEGTCSECGKIGKGKYFTGGDNHYDEYSTEDFVCIDCAKKWLKTGAFK